MKAYEQAFDHRLPPGLPIVLRLDGNSFSKFTKKAGFAKPFDERMQRPMVAATSAVLEYASGAVLGYTQSDEITIVVAASNEPFLGGRVQKISSLCAAVCTAAFTEALRQEGIEAGPVAFDCRTFVMRADEVVNCLIWRQEDAFKNCVGAVAWYGLLEKYGTKKAQKMLHGQSTDARQEIVFSELGQNINDMPEKWRRGVCVRRVETVVPIEEAMGAEKYAELLAKGHVEAGQTVSRRAWTPDWQIPRFTADRDYIASLLEPKTEART